MLRSRFVASLGVVIGAFLLVSCSDQGPPDPTAPIEATTPGYTEGSGDDSESSGDNSGPGSLSDPTNLELRAVWWRSNYRAPVSVSKTIGPSGGTITMPETGLTMSFPSGAVSAPLTITVTADDKYVAYKMEPAGTQFLKDVTVTQLLKPTELYGEPLRTELYAAYIADDNLQLSGKVPVLEIEPSKTIFSTLSPLFPEAHVWVIRHFSRYMLASG